MSRLSYWLERFWWLRGVVAAFSLLGIITQAVPWSRFEVLRAAHAILVGWNLLAAKIGTFLGLHIVFPDMGAAAINALIVCTTVFLPWGAASFYRGQSRIFYFRWSLATFGMLPIFFLNLLWNFAGYHHPLLLMMLLAAATYLPVKDLILKFPAYGRGIVWAFSFLLCWEVLYFLNLPVVQDYLNEFSCSILNDDFDDCANF